VVSGKCVLPLPGVRLKVSKTGGSLSVGERGAAINFKPGRAPDATIGLPGTGLSYSVIAGTTDNGDGGQSQGQFMCAGEWLNRWLWCFLIAVLPISGMLPGSPCCFLSGRKTGEVE